MDPLSAAGASHADDPVDSEDVTASGGDGMRTTRQGRRWIAPLAVVLVGLGLTAVLLAFVWQRERDAQARLLGERAGQITDSLRTGLALPVEVLQGMAALFDSSRTITRAQFRDYVRGALNRYPAIYALEWIPRVNGRDRAGVEAAARADGQAGFQFTDEGPGGRFVRAGERAEHLPILYMEPVNRSELGFDIAAMPAERQAADAAAATGQPRATARLRLVGDGPDSWSVAVLQPIYKRGFEWRTSAEQHEQLLGFVAVVFGMRPVMAQALRGVDATGLDVVLDDRSAPGDPSNLYEISEGLSRRLELPGAITRETSLAFAGRNWAMRFQTRLLPTASQAALMWGVALGGLVISVLAATSISATRIIRRLRREVRAALHLGQYTLDHEIGAGGMGVVYRARHAMLRRPTAVKLLKHSAHHGESLKRFEREVQLTSRLTHPNTIAIYDYGRTPEGVLYYAMEYLEGITLDELVRRHGPQPPARVVHILEQICGALGEAHGVGLIHRDIKPGNLMLCVRGDIPDFVKVLDFGLVKEVGADDDTALTGQRHMIGSPQYLAPEAVRGAADVDARADIYGLGAVAYFLLCGKPVFDGRTTIELCSQHLSDEPVPPSEKLGQRLPAALEELVLHCLAKDPADRPQSAEELRETLRDLADDDALGEWDEEDARAWWIAHPAPAAGASRKIEVANERARAAANRKDPPPDAPPTITVDLRRRAARR